MWYAFTKATNAAGGGLNRKNKPMDFYETFQQEIVLTQREVETVKEALSLAAFYQGASLKNRFTRVMDRITEQQNGRVETPVGVR